MKEDEKNAMLQEIDKSFSRIKVGKIVQGKIVKLRPKEVIVDIGLKSEGTIALSEFDDPSQVKVGNSLEVFLEGTKEETGERFMSLSKRKADALKLWKGIEESHTKKLSIEGEIKKVVKGGWVVDIKGMEAFLPGSQLDTMETKDMEKRIGETFSFRVIKFDTTRNTIVLSRRVILEEGLEEKRKELWEKVAPGQMLDGTVKSVVDFGVFVDIGGADALIHITDLSWGKIAHPSEVLRVGEKVKTKVLSVDKKEKRITLGIKQLTPSPWENIKERYPVDSKVKGKVTSLTDFGAFVELESGIEGLIHISEMSWVQRLHSPSQVLAVGDTVHTVVLDIDASKRKIALGLRQTQPNPWEKVKGDYPEGSVVTGTVTSFSNFGAFIELESGVEGLLHVSDLSWTEHIEHPSDVLKRKQRIKCKVLNVDPNNQRIALGLKQMEKDPLLILKDTISEPVKGKVKEIAEKGLVVKFQINKHRVEGFVPFSHLMKPDIKKIEDKYKVGEELNLKLLEADEERRRLILSEKEYYEPDEGKEKENSDKGK